MHAGPLHKGTITERILGKGDCQRGCYIQYTFPKEAEEAGAEEEQVPQRYTDASIDEKFHDDDDDDEDEVDDDDDNDDDKNNDDEGQGDDGNMDALQGSI